MLVRLYNLPLSGDLFCQLEEQGITIRRARPYEKHIVQDWVGKNFSPKWVSECGIAFTRQPVSCYIATREKKILGFACCEVTARGFLGPMGVGEDTRAAGLGKALLLAALNHLHDMGYVYAIIGGVGPAAFYEHCVNAIPIPDSSPGLYVDILPDP